jgi:hypothetical protein
MRPRNPSPGGPASAVLLTLLAAAVWFVAAWLRPGTTFHLAPVIVASALPWARWRLCSTRPGRLRTVLLGESLLVVAATTIALATTVLLAAPPVTGERER